MIEVSAELKSEITERIRIYTEEPDQVIDPDLPESQDNFDELVAFLEWHSEDNKLDAELTECFVADLETSMRNYGDTRGQLWRAVCKFYVDSGTAIPVDVEAYRDGRAWCSGGIKGATWFVFNKLRYEAK